ncbi:MAG: DUF2892 domain-containing protein [Anaerolineae bacterium]|nr:DUF2892 domain-containing protein [Anaerolineae bacterium]
MKPNVGELDKLLRTILGVYSMLLGFLFVQGVVGILVGGLGLVSLITGLVGRCGIYSLLGISTLGQLGPVAKTEKD